MKGDLIAYLTPAAVLLMVLLNIWKSLKKPTETAIRDLDNRTEKAVNKLSDRMDRHVGELHAKIDSLKDYSRSEDDKLRDRLDKYINGHSGAA